MLFLSFPQDQKKALVFPWLYAFSMSFLSFLICVTYHFYKKHCSRSKSHDLTNSCNTVQSVVDKKENEKAQLADHRIIGHGVFNPTFQNWWCLAIETILAKRSSLLVVSGTFYNEPRWPFWQPRLGRTYINASCGMSGKDMNGSMPIIFTQSWVICVHRQFVPVLQCLISHTSHNHCHRIAPEYVRNHGV